MHFSSTVVPFDPTRNAGFLSLDPGGYINGVHLLHGDPFACAVSPGESGLLGQHIDSAFPESVWKALRSACQLLRDGAPVSLSAAPVTKGTVYLPNQAGYEFHVYSAAPADAQAEVAGGAVVYLYEFVPAAGSRFWMAAADILCVLSPQGVVIDANPAWEFILGQNPAALRGTFLLDVVHPDDKNLFRAVLDAACNAPASDDGFAGEDQNYKPRDVVARMRVGNSGDEKNAYRWMQWTMVIDAGDKATSAFLFASARDVTETRKAEADMHWKAHHDVLTHLPNRALLEDRLNHALAGAQRRKTSLAVLFLDVNRLKPINDTWGHAAGDLVLCEVANRLKSRLREEDTVARLGGDEFVVVLPAVSGVQDAVRVGRKLLDAIALPISLPEASLLHLGSGGREIKTTASVGISLFPRDGHTAALLIKNADAAMYHAKSGHLREPHVFDSGDGIRTASGGLSDMDEVGEFSDFKAGPNPLQASLFRAVDRHEMRLHYQPQVCLLTGQTTGVEALLRWQNAQWGSVPPDTFIPLAEETGLMVPLGAWAIQEACRQGADWRRDGHVVSVAVNVSAHQLGDAHFPDKLLRCLDQLELPPGNVDIEITEAALVSGGGAASSSALGKLKKMGVRLSVDDWGTGGLATSAALLQKLPLDSLNVDRSLIQKVDRSEDYQEVVRAIIDLSHTLGMRVVAEGVETEAQRDTLAGLGCDAMQGYLVSAAVPPSAVRAFF